MWQSLSCHTLTLDYRGYGDSVMAAQLGESTVVEDAKTAIKLVRDTVGDRPKVGSSVDPVDMPLLLAVDTLRPLYGHGSGRPRCS